LLRELQKIELGMGRERNGRRWGPRCIDLDILLLDDMILHWSGLTVPHPRMHRRAFVLAPLLELEPDLLIPARGRARACLDRLTPRRVEQIAGVKSR
jgi:2-amino-4-hydroxy-6-hydroxymethyldihydropteridine diphosphokinase